EAGGTVSIWNIERRLAVAYCHTRNLHLYAVAFSPDGMIVAAAGRGPPVLCHAATGQVLLALQVGDWVRGLAFSPDGRKLAVSNLSPAGGGLVTVWELEHGRGTELLGGLSGAARKLCLSRDGKRLAALAQNWEVG